MALGDQTSATWRQQGMLHTHLHQAPAVKIRFEHVISHSAMHWDANIVIAFKSHMFALLCLSSLLLKLQWYSKLDLC